MAKGKGGASKNNPEKRTSTYNNLKLSNDCEKCVDKCVAGKKYIDRIKSGKTGIGIACKK